MEYKRPSNQKWKQTGSVLPPLPRSGEGGEESAGGTGTRESSMSLDTMAAPDTLSRSLQSSSIGLSQLRGEYGPMLQVVRLVIGVVPNCDSLLAIWPTGFRSYNMLVSNFLNLPFSVWGWGPPVVPLGLA